MAVTSEDKKAFEFFGIESVIIVLLIVVLLVVLSFLGVLPFGKITSFMQGKKVTTAVNVTPGAQVPDETGFGCILTPDICSKAIPISTTLTIPANPGATAVPPIKFHALGFTDVPKGTPLKAAISGSLGTGVASDPKTGERINLLSITNGETNTEVDYRFVGSVPQLDPAVALKIKKGQTIATLGDKTITAGADSKQYSVLFFVQDLTSREFKQLTSSDLK